MKKLTLITVIIISFLTTGLLNAQNISLYSVGNDTTGTLKLLFFKIDAFSALPTTIDTLFGVKNVDIGSSTFDHSCSHYIFSGNDSIYTERLFVVDTTATIMSNSIISDFSTYGLQYDMNNQILYALIKDTVTNYFNMGTINPNNSTINLINSLPELHSISSAAYAYNSNTGKYIFCGTDNNYDKRLYCINAQDGTIESNPLANDCYLSELQYDVTTNKLYGLHRDTSNVYLFNFVEIDLLTANVIILNPLNEINSINVATSVYDQNTGSFIFKGTDTSMVSRLYIINPSTGQIISNSEIEETILEIECDNTRFAKEFYTSVKEETMFNNLAIYPNPSQGVFTLAFTVENPQDVNIQVVNNIGQVVYKKQHKNYKGNYSGKIDLSTYANGAYILNITIGENTHTENITVLR